MPGMRDQRTMTGRHRPRTIQGVRRMWDTTATTLSLTLHPGPHPLHAYVNWGRWVADCPTCWAGIACWPDNPDAACFGCGTVWPITYPTDHAEIAAALEPRPEPNRNWTPGETLPMLVAETMERV